MKTLSPFCCALASFTMLGLFPLPLTAREIHVRGDAASGNEKETSEEPFRSITQAARVAQAGDTILVHPIPEGYRETVDLYGLSGGQPDNPIVIDGQGSTLLGSDPVVADGWNFDSLKNLYTRSDIRPQLFLIINEALVFETYARDRLEPGEFAYVEKLNKRLYHHPLTKGEAPEVEITFADGTSRIVPPSEWKPAGSSAPHTLHITAAQPVVSLRKRDQTIPLITAPDRLQPGQWCEEDGIVYFKPAEKASLAELRIEACVRSNGIQLNGSTSHIVIKNFNVRYVSNDGYNIHGKVRDISFYNCNARDVGDEGFSAHTDCQTLLDGAYYENCGTGIGNMSYSKSSEARTVTRNVIIRSPRTDGFRAGIRINEVQHVLENAILIDCPTGLKIGKGVMASNVLILSTSPTPKQIGISLEDGGNLERVAVMVNGSPLRILGEGPFAIRQSSLDGRAPIHLRSTSPLSKIINLKEISVLEGLSLESGERPPWEIRPAKEAFSQAGETIHSFSAISLDTFLNDLQSGKLPGPSAALVEEAFRTLRPLSH